MEPLRLNAAQGWEWVKQGFALFVKAPLLWIVFLILLFAAAIGFSSLPVIGDPLVSLLMPVLLAGMMEGCRSLEHGDELELAHFFSGFKQNTSFLITLGGITLVGQFLILGVMMITGGGELVALFSSNQPDMNPNVLMEAIYNARFSLMLGVALYLFLMSITQFATLLVYFKGLPPVQALQLTFRAFLDNVPPLLVFGMTFLLLGVLSTLAMGIGWLVLLPLSFTSLYTCYSGIFPPSNEKSGTPAQSKADTPGDQSNT